jgi:hypothetical protein
LGIGIAMMVDAVREKDKSFRNMALCIFVSFGFYIPVILFVREIPEIGMLMIPKTLAYVAMAWIAYRNMYKPKAIAAA